MNELPAKVRKNNGAGVTGRCETCTCVLGTKPRAPTGAVCTLKG